MNRNRKSCTFWLGKTRVSNDPAQCSRSGAYSQGRATAHSGRRLGLGCGIWVGGDLETKKSFEFLLPWRWHGASLATHVAAWPSQELQDQLSAVLCTCNPWEPCCMPVCWEEGCCPHKVSTTWKFLQIWGNCMFLIQLCCSELAKDQSS